MTYSSGGLIQASDFNALAGTTSVGSSAVVNQIWSVGWGDCGYGQSAIASVAAGGTVSATNWAALINTLNSIRTHQSGSNSGISAPTSGSTVTYLSTLSSAISTAYSSRTSAVSNGTNGSLAKNLVINAAGASVGSATATWTVTWGNVDQARYFFNAGGYLYVQYGTFTNTGGTARGTSINTLCQTNFNAKTILIHSMGARTGTGGTVIADVYGVGYYELPAAATQYCRINSTSYYSGDYCYMNVNTSGGAGSYAANGNILTVTFGAYSGTTGASWVGGTEAINITQAMNLVVMYPETTNLSSSWGTVTIA